MQPDSGYHDPDRSGSFEAMLSSLDHFQSANFVRAARRTIHRLLRPRPGVRLLDAGCGTGVDVARLAGRVQPGGLIVGLDLSERFIETARARHGHRDGVEFKTGDIRKIPYPDAYFDGAFAFRVVRYLDNQVDAARELARVTRPGGRVVLCEGGMGTVDLPDHTLTRGAFQAPGRSPGTYLPNVLKRAGLIDISVHPAFGVSIGAVDPRVMDYVRNIAGQAVDEGEVTAEEAAAWLREVEATVENGEWFSADCLFVVVGTVA